MRVAVIHPWFPQYRLAFFDELLVQASQQGITIDIFHGDPPPEWNERGDSLTKEYAVKLPTQFFRAGSRNLVLKDPRPVWNRGPYDVIVVEQAVRNLETYAFLLKRGGAKLAFWGHGKTYTARAGRIQEKLKQLLTKRGDWFFAYTAGGAAAVEESGYRADRITVVHNSIDSVALQRSMACVTETIKRQFANKHDLKGKTCLFIGGLDESKRLDFLLEAADAAHKTDPDFRLVIAGSGAGLAAIIEASELRPWLVQLGPLFAEDKATALAVADILLMPGRVGLVAVDSFAAGRPIITTDWPFHAPEFEYLRPGLNSVVTANNVVAYSDAIVAILNDRAELRRLQQGALESSGEYTVAQMASNFLNGLQSVLSMRDC